MGLFIGAFLVLAGLIIISRNMWFYENDQDE